MSIIYGFYNALREHYASAEQTTRCVIGFAMATAFVGLLMASSEATLLTVLISAALSWGMYLRLCVLGGAPIRENGVRLIIVGGLCNLISGIGMGLMNAILAEVLHWPAAVSSFIAIFAGTYLVGRLFVALFHRNARQKSCS